MARPQLGESEVLIEGKNYTLKLTLGALADIEAATGAKTLGEIDKIFNEPSATGLIISVSAMLAAGGDMPLAEAKKLVARQSLSELRSIAASMGEAVAASTKKEDGENPQVAAGT